MTDTLWLALKEQITMLWSGHRASHSGQLLGAENSAWLTVRKGEPQSCNHKDSIYPTMTLEEDPAPQMRS